jgi:chromosome segregation ATPase
MRRWILAGAVGLLGGGLLGWVFLPTAGAEEQQAFSEEMRGLLAQYEILKTQSMTLSETVKSLEEERRRLIEEVGALRKREDLIPKVKELSEALDQARQSLGILRTNYAAALARVEELERAQLKTLTQRTQELKRSLEEISPEEAGK